MKKAINKVLIFYAVGAIATLLSYFIFDNSYGHAPSPYHFVAVLTLLVGAGWTLVTLKDVLLFGSTTERMAIIMAHLAVLIAFVGYLYVVISTELSRNSSSRLAPQNLEIDASTMARNVRTIPADLEELGVVDFFEPDEILRVWRFPEGGAVFGEMLDVVREEESWSVTRYTYLLSEYSGEPDFQNIRRKLDISTQLRDRTPLFINAGLLELESDSSHLALEDLYQVEYRKGNQMNQFVLLLSQPNEKITELQQMLVETFREE